MLETVAKELPKKFPFLSHCAGYPDVDKITKGLGKYLSLQKYFTFRNFFSVIQSYWNEKLGFSPKMPILYCSKNMKSDMAFLEGHHWKHCSKGKQNATSIVR